MRGIQTLADVVKSGVEIVDVVTQDEYTHDVVARDGDRWLVYDST